MITKYNLPLSKISWLKHFNSGIISTFYEPETKEELIDICCSLYKDGKKFDLIGYTSNIYFLPSYNSDVMVSTRKVKKIIEQEGCVIADCGVSVSMLSRQMVNQGIKGFEGLIDIPGTVGASVYGNAACYGCSINQLLESFEILRPDSKIENHTLDILKIEKRSTALKRGELEGVILSVRMRKEIGNKVAIMKKAEAIHQLRNRTQPGPKDNLGSIYSNSGKWTKKGMTLYLVAKAISILMKPIKHLSTTRIILYMLGYESLIPYVWGWNRFIWKNEESHELFWMYHEIHKKLFVNNDFEIVIKGSHAI